MADWQFTLNLKDVWKKISVDETAKIAVERIRELLPKIRRQANTVLLYDTSLTDTLADLADELENEVLPLFEDVVEVGENDVEMFDNAMYNLYEWADTSLDNEWEGKKMCWVSTVL